MDTRQNLIEASSVQCQEEFLHAVARSRALHHPWVSPPQTVEAFVAYLHRLTQPSHVGYGICTPTNALAGVININEIVRGSFCSEYLGYYAFVPHAGCGYMRRGLRAVISRAFGPLRLHRLEANIQPDNEASRRLVQQLGFRQEGVSPRYLKIAGRWRDHERWALTAEEWMPRARVTDEHVG